jgi:hypothetical protein
MQSSSPWITSYNALGTAIMPYPLFCKDAQMENRKKQSRYFLFGGTFLGPPERCFGMISIDTHMSL